VLLADIATEVGFGSVSRFHAVFREHTGTSPAAFRRALRAG
jgi:AraC-like DNA-binding protein